MGEYLPLMPYPRNAFAKTGAESAQKAKDTISLVRAIQAGREKGFDSKAREEQFNDARLFLRTVEGAIGSPTITDLGYRYEQYFELSPGRAWRWLSIRGAWLGFLPNSSGSSLNKVATQRGDQVNLFDLLIRSMSLLEAEPGANSSITIDEYVEIMSDDENWNWTPYGIAPKVLELRKNGGSSGTTTGKHLLQVESQLGLARDSLNTLFAKFAVQTGLFELRDDGSGNPHHSVRISPDARSQPFLANLLDHTLKYPHPY